MENARNNCSIKTSAAISWGIVIFDKDNLKSIFFIRFSWRPLGPPTKKKIFSPLLKINYEKEEGFEYDVQKRIPDTSKAEKILNFKAKITIEESISEVTDWIKNEINNERM